MKSFMVLVLRSEHDDITNRNAMKAMAYLWSNRQWVPPRWDYRQLQQGPELFLRPSGRAMVAVVPNFLLFSPGGRTNQPPLSVSPKFLKSATG